MNNKLPHEANGSRRVCRLMRKLSQKTDRIVIHSKETVNILKKIDLRLNQNKISFIPHPNYIVVYEDKNIDFRNRLNINSNAMVSLVVGQLRI